MKSNLFLRFSCSSNCYRCFRKLGFTACIFLPHWGNITRPIPVTVCVNVKKTHENRLVDFPLKRPACCTSLPLINLWTDPPLSWLWYLIIFTREIIEARIDVAIDEIRICRWRQGCVRCAVYLILRCTLMSYQPSVHSCTVSRKNACQKKRKKNQLYMVIS